MLDKPILLNLKKISFLSYLGVLIVYPYLFVLQMVMPSSLLGSKCVYIYLATVLLIIIFLLRWRFFVRFIPVWVVWLFLCLTTSIYLLNLFFYSDIKHLDVLRIPYNLVIYLGVAYVCTRDISQRKIVYNVILFNCVIQAVIGIIHFYYFPYIMTGICIPGLPYHFADPATATAQAERGLVENPNLFMLFLLLGCFLLVYRDKIFKKHWILETISFILLMWAINLSNSRLGILCSWILGVIYFKKFIAKGKIVIAGLIIMGLILCSGVIVKTVNRVKGRSFSFSDSYVGENLSRTAKNTNAFNLLVDDWSNVLIGPSRDRTIEFKLVQQRNYSDNSFFLLFHNYGLPAGLVIIFVMCYLYDNVINIKKRGIIFILIYFAIALFLYNSLLYDMWLVFFSATLMLLGRKDDKDSRLTKTECA